jgi:hypothetical protein
VHFVREIWWWRGFNRSWLKSWWAPYISKCTEVNLIVQNSHMYFRLVRWNIQNQGEMTNRFEAKWSFLQGICTRAWTLRSRISSRCMDFSWLFWDVRDWLDVVSSLRFDDMLHIIFLWAVYTNDVLFSRDVVNNSDNTIPDWSWFLGTRIPCRTYEFFIEYLIRISSLGLDVLDLLYLVQ